jgi:tryptophan synthase alpha chain
MSRIATVFVKSKHKALIAYVTVGYPTLEATLEVVPLLEASGCDIIELGIPFSDPLADGATIQTASYRALQGGVTPQSCLEVVKSLREKVKAPLIFMTYYNPVLHFGLEPFCAACNKVGLDGLIVPDLPPDEGTALETVSKEQGIDLIYLLAPNSTQERIRLVAEKTRGFIYLVSLTGVTGMRKNLPSGIDTFVAKVRQESGLPLCVGFGISTSEQAAIVARVADGIIVGSRFVQLITEKGSHYRPLTDFVTELRESLDKL